MRNSKVKGFTLIELIVVIAIIGVLAAILVPSMLGYVQNSRITQANANAKQIYTAVSAELTQASIDGRQLSENNSGGSWAWTAEITPDSIKGDKTINGLVLFDYLGDGYSGHGKALINKDAYTIKAAAWGSNANCLAKGVAKNENAPSSDDQKKEIKASNIVYGYYPLKGETPAAGGNTGNTGK